MNRSPGLVDQHRAFAAHRLADERHRPRGDVERGRMELDELQVGEYGAGARGERQRPGRSCRADWCSPRRVRRCRRSRSRPCRPANSAGPAARPRGRREPHCPRRSAGAPRSPRAMSIEGVARAAATRARMNSRPVAVAAGMDDARPARARPRGRARSRRPASRSKAHAEPREPLDRGGRGAREAAATIAASHEAVAGGERVGSMKGRAVVARRSRPRRRLAPRASSASGSERRLRDRSAPAAARAQRGHQAGDAAADDDDAPAAATASAVTAPASARRRGARARRGPDRS